MIITYLTLSFVNLFFLLVATNPDHTLPLQPELLGCGLLALLAGARAFEGKNIHQGRPIAKEEIQAVCMILFCVLGITFPRVLISLFHSRGQVWTPCLNTGSNLTIFECFAHAAINQNYGFRSFYMLFSATFLGIVAFAIARWNKNALHSLIAGLITAPILVATVGFLFPLFGISQLLPESLGLNTYGSRFTQIFTNPSWVWPYLAPTLCLLLTGFSTARSLKQRILFFLGFSFIAGAAIGTGQRGGLLQVGIILFIFIIYNIRFVRPLNRRAIFYVILLVSLCLPVLIQYLHIYSLSGFISHERIAIWQAAWDIFKERPISGIGYAGWYQAIRFYGATHNMNEVWDTAHNLYIQTIVELGIVHSSVIFFCLVWVFRLAYRNSASLPGGGLLALTSGASFLTITFFQEVDYIRPVFYMHSLFWGTLTGLPVPEIINVKVYYPDRKTIKRTGFGLIAFAFIFLIAAAFSRYYFSRAYAYESIFQIKNAPVVRWLGTNSSLTAFGNSHYSLFRMSAADSGIFPVYLESPNGEMRINPHNDEIYIAIENNRNILPVHHPLRFNGNVRVANRLLTAQMFYPPIKSNLALFTSTGLGSWKNYRGFAGRACQGHCQMLASSCGMHNGLSAKIFPDRELDKDELLGIRLQIWNAGCSYDATQKPSDLHPPVFSRMLKIPNEGYNFNFSLTEARACFFYLTIQVSRPGSGPQPVITEVPCLD